MSDLNEPVRKILSLPREAGRSLEYYPAFIVVHHLEELKVTQLSELDPRRVSL